MASKDLTLGSAAGSFRNDSASEQSCPTVHMIARSWPRKTFSKTLVAERTRRAATHVRYYVLAVGCGLSLLLYLHRQSFVRAHPDIGESLGLNAEQFGNMQSAFLIGYAIFQVPCGLIGDRLGARHLLTFLILAWSLVTGLTALAGCFRRVPAGRSCFCWRRVFCSACFRPVSFPVWSRVMRIGFR